MAEKHSQHEESTDLVCPKCEFHGMRRVRRQGWLERRVMYLFGYYPWECVDCREISMLKLRKVSASHASAVAESSDRATSA